MGETQNLLFTIDPGVVRVPVLLQHEFEFLGQAHGDEKSSKIVE